MSTQAVGFIVMALLVAGIVVTEALLWRGASPWRKKGNR